MSSVYVSKIVAKSFPEALSAVENALKDSGFGIISRIDFQAAFKEKLNKDTLRSVSLGACNPGLAYKVVSADESLAVMLPCHVTVQEQSGGPFTRVTFIDPQQMFSSFMQKEHPELKEIAEDADHRLKTAFNKL